MRICVFGAGAIGAYLGVQLRRAGAEVSLVARGAHLAAMREHGVTLEIAGERITLAMPCTDDPRELGPQDYVIATCKAHSLAPAAESLLPLLGPETPLVTAFNGIPYWYFHGIQSPWREHVLASVDPERKLWNLLGPERAIGCILYPAADLVAPGVVKHGFGDRLPLGEPTGERTQRVERLSALFTAAGFKAPVLDRIRDEIWLKLWGNVSFNPISALTHATLEEIVSDPSVCDVARRMMRETEAVARRLGAEFRVDLERRIAGAGEVGAHKTSMLVDLETGRPLEIDALVTVVQELGRLVGIATPTIDCVLGLVCQRARVAGLYP